MCQLGAEYFEPWETPVCGSELKCTESLFGGCIATSVKWDELRSERVKLIHPGFF